jgi:predicted phosphodiesterase
VRLALISDIHGNAAAFDAVLADAERVGVDGYVCLGDTLQGGPQPAEVLERLRGLGCPVVLGNGDEFLLRLPREAKEPASGRQEAVREWTRQQLGTAGLAFVETMSPTVRVPLGEAGELLAFHGSPLSSTDVLLPWSAPEALAPFRGTGAPVLAGGHTHTQWTRTVDGALFVNPGSIGVPYDHHQPDDAFRLTAVAEYAFLNVTGDAATVEFRRIPFAVAALRAAAGANGFPDESFLEVWAAPDGSRPA